MAGRPAPELLIHGFNQASYYFRLLLPQTCICIGVANFVIVLLILTPTSHELKADRANKSQILWVSEQSTRFGVTGMMKTGELRFYLEMSIKL